MKTQTHTQHLSIQFIKLAREQLCENKQIV